jgi:hypothetical protein
MIEQRSFGHSHTRAQLDVAQDSWNQIMKCYKQTDWQFLLDRLFCYTLPFAISDLKVD